MYIVKEQMKMPNVLAFVYFSMKAPSRHTCHVERKKEFKAFIKVELHFPMIQGQCTKPIIPTPNPYSYFSVRRGKVELCFIKVVLFILYDVRGVELVQDTVQSSTISVVSHTTSVVTLAGQVTKGVILYVLKLQPIDGA